MISPLSTGRALPVTVATSAPSVGSQVAKHPSLYWLATPSVTAGTGTRSAIRTISVKKPRRPSSRPAAAIAVGVSSVCQKLREIVSPTTSCAVTSVVLTVVAIRRAVSS